MAVEINEELCNSCGTCVDECPAEALSIGEDCVEVDEDVCLDCGVCVDACPNGALSI
ncbi:MAG: 4Fe-4S binding protein [Coriobacteriales bacterium]|nr:4Fe-4S binding protein [Coriobacteriales bacterium]